MWLNLTKTEVSPQGFSVGNGAAELGSTSAL